jgi:HEAT repeat protein
VLVVILLPQHFVIWPLAVVFFLSGYVNTAFNATNQHYFISITSTERQLPQGILTQGLGGIAGGIALVVGGWALEYVRPLVAGSPDPLLHFRLFYGGVVVLLLIRTVIFFKLPALDSQRIRDALNALFSPSDWRAIHAVKRAVAVQSEDEESKALRALMRSNLGIYQEDLERYLSAPSIFVRQRALDMLMLAKPTRSLTAILLKDLQENRFTTAHQSAYWLGRWKVQEAVPLLRAALDSPDFLLCAKAVHALVELDDRASLPLIEAYFQISDNPLVLIEAARALSIWGETRHYQLLLDKYHLQIPPQAKDELSLSVARLLGLYDRFYRDKGMQRREPAQLYREWGERLAARDEEGLIEAMRAGAPRRTLLERALERQREQLQGWFYEATREFLARRPEKVFPEMAFLMTFLLLVSEGSHRRRD